MQQAEAGEAMTGTTNSTKLILNWLACIGRYSELNWLAVGFCTSNVLWSTNQYAIILNLLLMALNLAIICFRTQPKENQ